MVTTTMYTRILIVVVLLNSLYLPLYSQEKKDIYQLVPFKKANKWGLVFPDGQQFYPPEFDTIYLQNRSGMYSVFGKDKDKERAVVEKAGKVMWLSPEKKLTTISNVQRIIKREEKVEKKLAEKKGIRAAEEKIELMAVSVYENKPEPVEIPKQPEIKMLKGKNGSSLEIRQTANGYSFYRDNIHYPALDAEKYYTRDCYNGKCLFIILTKGGLQALMDPESLQILIPYRYNNVDYFGNKDEWKTIKKDGMYGVADITGKELVPPKYQMVYGTVVSFEADGHLPIVVKNNDRHFFLHYRPSGLSESEVSYDYLYFLRYNFSTKPETPLFVAIADGKNGIVTDKDSVVVPVQYDSISYPCDRDILLIYKNKKIGFCNIVTKFIKEPVYDEIIGCYRLGNIDRGSDYYILLVRKGEKYFYIDRFGKEFISV